MSGGVTGTHVNGESGKISDDNARDAAILALQTFRDTTAPGTFQPVDHTWTAGLAVKAGQLVEHSGSLYKVDADMTLPGSFDTTGLTSVGGGGGATPAPAKSVQYVANTYAGGGSSIPLFGAVTADTFDDGLDGVFCEIDGTTLNKVNFLASGAVAISAWGLMYNAGTTGGSFNVTVHRGGQTIVRSMQGAADPAGPEVDFSTVVTVAVSAGDSVTIDQYPSGADNTGNYTTLMITRVDSAASDPGDDGVIVGATYTADHTIVGADRGKVVQMNSASATVVTIPVLDNTTMPVGSIFEVLRLGAGTVTIAAGAGVTVDHAAATLQVAARYASATARKLSPTEWVVAGDLL